MRFHVLIAILAITPNIAAQSIEFGDQARAIHDRLHGDNAIKTTKENFEKSQSKVTTQVTTVDEKRTIYEKKCEYVEVCEPYGLFGRKTRKVLVLRECLVPREVVEKVQKYVEKTVKYSFTFPEGQFGEAAKDKFPIGQVPDSAGAKAKLLKKLLDNKIFQQPAHAEAGALNLQEVVLGENLDFSNYILGSSSTSRICRFQVTIKIEGEKDEFLTISVRVMENNSNGPVTDKSKLDALAGEFLSKLLESATRK